jgi:hypothetical protein
MQVVQHGMNLATGVVGYDFIHEIQEFPPATSGVVRGLDHSRGDLQAANRVVVPVQANDRWCWAHVQAYRQYAN